MEYMNITELLIRTDSAYSIAVFNKVLTTDDLSTLDPSIPNLDLYHILKKELFLIPHIKVKLDKVKGHDVSVGNIMADRLAVMGRIVATRSSGRYMINHTPAGKYWSGEQDRHPLLKYKQLFFLTEGRGRGKPTYSIINYSGGIVTGKQIGRAHV